MTVLMLGKQLELGHYRAEFLRSYGIHVVFPESKKAAVTAIQQREFDTAILSYTLSDGTTKELVEMIKRVCPDCPLIGISKQRWDGGDFEPDETLLDTDPPQELLNVLRRVEDKLRQRDDSGSIRRVK